jgi:DNA-binding NarL/FixJ family response regulator
MINIIIADDHRLVREGVSAMLRKNKEIKILGVASTGEEAVNLAREKQPDVVLMDILMPGMNGIEASRWIKDLDDSARIIILSMEINRDYVTAAMRSGIDGYLPKDIGYDTLTDAIQRVYNGERVFHSAVEKLVLEDAYTESKKVPAEKKVVVNSLTKREKEVLTLVAGNKSNREIAQLLGISVKTVETHRSHILIKLGLNNNAEMMRYAVKNCIVSVPVSMAS